MTLFQRFPLELGCQVTTYLQDPRSLRLFRESSEEAREIVDSCVTSVGSSKYNVEWNDLKALPSVSRTGGMVIIPFVTKEQLTKDFSEVLMKILGSIWIRISRGFLPEIPYAMLCRKTLYPLSTITVQWVANTATNDYHKSLPKLSTVSWNGENKALTVIYHTDKVVANRYDEALGRLAAGTKELTYVDDGMSEIPGFWDNVNPVKLRKVVADSTGHDSLIPFLEISSRRFELRISIFRFENLRGPGEEMILDNWTGFRQIRHGLRAVYSDPASARHLRELYGLTVSSSTPPADLRSVSHALRDLKVVITYRSQDEMIRSPMSYQDLSPIQQARANLFLSAFPDIPITFH